MSNSRFNASDNAIEIARAAFEAKKIVRQSEDFDIFEVPPGDLDNRLLLLFKEGKDFLSGEYPGDILIPVKIDDRSGYLWRKKAAMAFRSGK